MKTKNIKGIAVILFLFLMIQNIMADFGYDNPTLPKITTTPKTTITSSNGSSIVNGSSYNSTYNNLLGQMCPSGQVVNGTLTNGTFICIQQSSSASSYNSTYDKWAYNQTIPSISYTDNQLANYYLKSNPYGFYNSTTLPNQSTYNSTYALFAYNQTIIYYSDEIYILKNSTNGFNFNISKVNVLINNSFNQTLTDSIYYSKTNPNNYVNVTSITNSTIARIGNCTSGNVVMNVTTNGVQCVSLPVDTDTWKTNYTNYYNKSQVDSNLSNYVLRNNWTSIDNYPNYCSGSDDYVYGINDTLQCRTINRTETDPVFTSYKPYLAYINQSNSFSGNITPSASSVYELGSPTNKWNIIYTNSLSATGNVALGYLLTSLAPSSTNFYNLGSSSNQWKSLWLSENATIGGYLCNASNCYKFNELSNWSWNEVYANTKYARYNYDGNNFIGTGDFSTTGNVNTNLLNSSFANINAVFPNYERFNLGETNNGAVTVEMALQINNTASNITHIGKFSVQDNNIGTVRAIFTCPGPTNASGGKNQGYMDFITEDQTKYIYRVLSLDSLSGSAFYLYDRETPQNVKVLLRSNGDSYMNGGDLGINTTTPSYPIDIQRISSGVSLNANGNIQTNTGAFLGYEVNTSKAKINELWGRKVYLGDGPGGASPIGELYLYSGTAWTNITANEWNGNLLVSGALTVSSNIQVNGLIYINSTTYGLTKKVTMRNSTNANCTMNFVKGLLVATNC